MTISAAAETRSDLLTELGKPSTKAQGAAMSHDMSRMGEPC